MKKTPYKSVLISMVTASIIILITAFYSIGVVEKAGINKTVDKRISKIEEKIIENQNASNLLMEEFSSDYESRAKVIAMLIAQNPSVLESEAALEELKSLISADELSITNQKGIIIYSTNTQDENRTANSELMPGILNKSFSKTVVTEINNEFMLVSGASRIDSSGIIQIIFTPEKLNKALKYSDISLVTSEFPLFKNGSTAIIDSKSLKYISHTNSQLIGLTSQFTKNDFKSIDENGNFYAKVNGKKAYIRYAVLDDKIILGIVPKSETFSKRNTASMWLTASLAILIFISYLSIRTYYINTLMNENKNEQQP